MRTTFLSIEENIKKGQIVPTINPQNNVHNNADRQEQKTN